MANSRTFRAEAVTTNGATALGGVTTITTRARFLDIVTSQPDGSIGAVVDRRGQAVEIEMESTDVAKGFTVLNGAEQATVFSTKESGAATYQRRTTGVTVLNRLSMQFARERDATMRLSGQCRFGSGEDVTDIITALAAQTAPTVVIPARLYRPFSAIWTETQEDPVTLAHVEALSLSLQAGLISDQNDVDLGTEAVDRVEFEPLEVTLTIRDFGVSGGLDRAVNTLAAGLGTLAVSLRGRGGAANKTLTIRNLQWRDASPEHGPGYSQAVLSGVAGWHDLRPAANPAVFTLTGANALAAFA